MAEKFNIVHKGPDDLYDLDCSSCKEEELNTEAQHFRFGRKKNRKKNVCDSFVSDLNRALPEYELRIWGVSGKIDALMRCDQHEANTIKLYCVDDDQLCCHICASVDHR